MTSSGAGGVSRFEDPCRYDSFKAPTGPVWWMATHRVTLPVDGNVISARYLVEGNRVILSTDKHEIALFDVPTCKITWKLVPGRDVNDVQVCDTSADGSQFITMVQSSSANCHGWIEVRETRTGRVLKTVREHSRYYHSCHGETCDHRPPKNRKPGVPPGGGTTEWPMAPGGAQFSFDGSRVLVRWLNRDMIEDIYDQHYSMYDFPSMNLSWAWSVYHGGQPHDSCRSRGYKSFDSSAMMFMSRTGRIIYSIPEGGIFEFTEDTVRNAMAIENICRRPPGSPLMRVDMTGMARYGVWLEFSQDDGKMLSSWKDGNGYRITLIDLNARRVLVQSDAIQRIVYASFAPADKLIVSGGHSSLVIWDSAGRLQSVWPANPAGTDRITVALHPGRKEVMAFRGRDAYLIHERRPRTVKLVPGEFTPTGAYIRHGVDLYIAGTGPVVFRSGDVEIRKPFSGTVKALTSTAAGNAVMLLPDEKNRFGEVFLRSERGEEVQVFGGLTKDEYASMWGLRSRLSSW